MFAGFRTVKLFAVALFAFTLAVPAFSDTVEVGTCIQNLVHFDTIQDAVDHAAQGGGTTIDVCPGSYPEQVTINKNLTLRGVADPGSNQDAAIIVAPQGGIVANTTSLSNGTPIAAQILVTSPATQVSIISLTVDGSGNNLPDCSVDLIGIYYQKPRDLSRHQRCAIRFWPRALEVAKVGLAYSPRAGKTELQPRPCSRLRFTTIRKMELPAMKSEPH